MREDKPEPLFIETMTDFCNRDAMRIVGNIPQRLYRCLVPVRRGDRSYENDYDYWKQNYVAFVKQLKEWAREMRFSVIAIEYNYKIDSIFADVTFAQING